MAEIFFEKAGRAGDARRDEKVDNCAHFVTFFRVILIDNSGVDMLSYKMMEIMAFLTAVILL